MAAAVTPIVVLRPANGNVPDLAAFTAAPEQLSRFQAIPYPGWPRYASDGFSASALLEDLLEEVVQRVPQGPVRLVGVSIGGHFAYAIALRLVAMGREVRELCVIDTFMRSSLKASAGWQSRALHQGLDLLRGQRFYDLGRFLRSQFWRALLRASGSRLPQLVRKLAPAGRLPAILAIDPVFDEELSMRLLIRETDAWVAALDKDPAALRAPAILLRARSTAVDDAAWRLRCPNIRIQEIPGQHSTLFDPENIVSLREAIVAATDSWS